MSTSMIDQATRDKITKAQELRAKIDALNIEIDALLDPICQHVMAEGEYQDLKEMLDILPEGFHRSELRTFVNRL